MAPSSPQGLHRGTIPRPMLTTSQRRKLELNSCWKAVNKQLALCLWAEEMYASLPYLPTTRRHSHLFCPRLVWEVEYICLHEVHCKKGKCFQCNIPLCEQKSSFPNQINVGRIRFCSAGSRLLQLLFVSRMNLNCQVRICFSPRQNHWFILLIHSGAGQQGWVYTSNSLICTELSTQQGLWFSLFFPNSPLCNITFMK